MRISEILTEKVSELHIHSGWVALGGDPVMADLRLWESPGRQEFESAIRQCFAMAGDPNLRGFAHAGKVYLWDAEKATHSGVMAALGIVDGINADFDYSNPTFCFFMVYGGRWDENDAEPIVISYNGSGNNLEVLKATIARRWKNIQYRDGGPFMRPQ